MKFIANELKNKHVHENVMIWNNKKNGFNNFNVGRNVPC